MPGQTGPKLSVAERALVVEQVRQGVSKTEVGRRFGISATSVHRICKCAVVETAAEIALAVHVEAAKHALDDRDAMVRALLEDAEAARSANLADIVTIKTIRHRSYAKDGTIADEWEDEEPRVDWDKAVATGAVRCIKRFSNTSQGQSVELHDRSTAQTNVMAAAKLRGWDVTKLEHSGEVASKVYIGQHPSELLPRADGNPND